MLANEPGIPEYLLKQIWYLFDILFFFFAVLYFIFALIVVRQVYLMTATVSTEAVGILKFLSIVHALVALAVIVIFFLFL